jgi:Ion channel
MPLLGACVALALIVLTLQDGFEAIILTRRVSRMLRPARLYIRSMWALCRLGVRLLPHGKRRDYLLSVFGPLVLLSLFALWAFMLIGSFALLYYSTDVTLNGNEPTHYMNYFYLSGVTFFTLGYGDVTASTTSGRLLTVAEASLGFGFLAVVIGYLPVLYQTFSKRERTISLLDARAGSPPSAAELLRRLARANSLAASGPMLVEWESWAAELLEGIVSFPVLAFYRSQHDNQSWLSTLTMILDTCALLLTSVAGADRYQARLTFAMARHAAVDLAQVFKIRPLFPRPDRLSQTMLAGLLDELRTAGLTVREDSAVEAKLGELRGLYEPFVCGLAALLLMPTPPVVPEKTVVDNWQTSAWMRRAAGFGKLPAIDPNDDHFD